MHHIIIEVDIGLEAVLVFDKSQYIVQHLSRAVDQVRRYEIREKGNEHKALMTRTRYPLAEEPVETHREAAGAVVGAGTTEPQDQSCLRSQRSLSRVLVLSGCQACPALSG